MSPHAPTIHFESGLAIGYQSPLASFGKAVTLTGGTHFLLARNGRGKTTLLRTLAGTLKPLAGNFRLTGFTQYLPEDMHFDPYLEPATLLRMLLAKPRLIEALDLANRLEVDLKKTYGHQSTGNRRKINLIATEFSTRPDTGNILLLDEPFSGLDAFAREVFEEIWHASTANVLRLVSCHPDYDAMAMPSALMIESHTARHLNGDAQTWCQLKNLMN